MSKTKELLYRVNPKTGRLISPKRFGKIKPIMYSHDVIKEYVVYLQQEVALLRQEVTLCKTISETKRGDKV